MAKQELEKIALQIYDSLPENMVLCLYPDERPPAFILPTSELQEWEEDSNFRVIRDRNEVIGNNLYTKALLEYVIDEE